MSHATPTMFISTLDVATIIRSLGMPALLNRLVARLEADFRRWPEFDKAPRLASHSPGGVIELMPIADARTYSFKYVNGHPANPLLGLPTVMAFGVLAEVATGLPQVLSELTLTTALRTAATSVMAARVLARPDARCMALIGNGAQSEFQALAFHYQLGIDRLQLYDIDQAATAKLVHNLRTVPMLTLEICATARAAVQGADIITTITGDKSNATVITADMVEAGVHINAVGGDCPGKTELQPQVLHRGAVFVEYEPQTRIEGDIQQMPRDFPVTELWQVLEGSRPGRRSSEQVTIFDSVGFALEDFSSLHVINEAAGDLGLGQPLALVPNQANPKDLFGYLETTRQRHRP